MKSHLPNHSEELVNTARTLDISLSVTHGTIAKEYISDVLCKYKPWKTSGHLSIGGNAKNIPFEENEKTFSNSLPQESARIFFEQSHANKNIFIELKNAKEISKLMSECYGMEYFISDGRFKYLIAVNWYSIEYIGDVVIS